MRILQLHTAYRQRGGEDGVVATEAQLVRDAGHEVHTHLAHNPEEAGPAAARLAVAPWNPRAARRIAQLVGRIAPDVVHVHNTWFSLSPSVLAAIRSRGTPTVLTLHNYRLLCAAATLYRDGGPCQDCVGSHPWHGVQHRCYRDSLPQSAVAASSIALHHRRRTWHRDVDRFLALSEFGRQVFVRGGLPAERITVKGNSVPDPGPRVRPPSASRTVVFVGRLTEEKGVELLLDAWRDATPDLELVIAGTGPLEPTLHRRAPAGVRFLGRLPGEEVTALLLRARALVFPSRWYEGQPLVPLEAAAAGLPVLLSDLGAMTELFAPDSDALLVPAFDVSAWSAALRRLEDDDLVDRAGVFTRSRYEERATPAVATRQLVRVYEEVRREVRR